MKELLLYEFQSVSEFHVSADTLLESKKSFIQACRLHLKG